MRCNNSGLREVWLGLVVIVLALSSCVPIKKQVYLQHADSDTKKEYLFPHDLSYRLRPGNNLFIKVSAIDSQVNDYFNMGYGTSQNYYQDAGIYLNSYSINDSGIVELPFIGKVSLIGLTLEESKDIIQKEVDKYLVETMVIVKLVNYTVTVVGEVVRPGQYKIYQDRVNIFEVLGIAGDLTTYANRDEVLLVRKTNNGSKMHRINLLQVNTLESEFFYIMPDDIVYVSPVRGKNFAFQTFPYALVISSISLMIGLFALLN